MATETLTQTIATLSLRPAESKKTEAASKEGEQKQEQEQPAQQQEPYRYTHLLPVFSADRYPPLEPFEHVDPGSRALSHPNPRSFLDQATSVHDLTPNLGSEIHGVNLAMLNSDERDQIALEVGSLTQTKFTDSHFARWLGVVFWSLGTNKTSSTAAENSIVNGEDILDACTFIRHLVILKAYRKFTLFIGRFISLTSHLQHVYFFNHSDANSTLNFEVDDSITSTVWHSDVSYELQPPGLTTFFLLSQPRTGGDTLFTSQVSTLKKLSPAYVAFLKTLKAVHSGIEQADFSRAGRRGGIVRREPVEHIHPVIRRHPVTGEEALYVNKQFTRRIVGLKKEESGLSLREVSGCNC